MPNAGYYEFSTFDSTMLDFFLKRKINVFMWNYRGFARSKGTLTMKNLLSDTEEIIDVIQKKIGCNNLAIYGRSLGGYAAVNMAEKVDLVILDRTFNNISFLARLMFNGFIQKVFDFYLDNGIKNFSKFMNVEVPKIVIFDSTDEIIQHLSSLTTGITSFFVENYIKKRDTLNSEFNSSINSGMYYSPKVIGAKANRWNMAKKLFANLNLNCFGKLDLTKNCKDNDKAYNDLVTNLQMSSMIINDKDAWILFLAIRR